MYWIYVNICVRNLGITHMLIIPLAIYIVVEILVVRDSSAESDYTDITV